MALEHLLETIILGVIQGLTEWFPISSTGHLRITERYLFPSTPIPILFDVTLHIGTLIITLLFFRKDVKNIFLALLHLDFKTDEGRLIPLIVIGTIPAVLIGLVFSDLIESAFQTAVPIAVALILCGILLFSSRFAEEKNDRITYFVALLIGIAQGIAVIPGISRSGATIATALLIGVKKEKAFRFSFLLSIPAIIGALGLTVYKEHEALVNTGFTTVELLLGVLAAMAVSYFALKWLRRIVISKKFYLFAFYCWLFGAILLILGLKVF
jgi:undecaprenyl-diphosphatase